MPHVQIIVNGETRFEHDVVSVTLHNHVPEHWSAKDVGCMAVDCDIRSVHA